VSGVSGLFSVEFYRDVRRYLKDDGLFLQWVHVYEMTPPLVATIITALGQNFEDFELWLPNHGDLIVVAVPKGRLPRLDGGAFANPALRLDLARFNIRNLDDLLLHRIGGRAALAPYYNAFGVQPNSDFAPVLDLNAGLARFLRQQVDSVLAQLEGEDELVIVDDASTDDSLKLLRAIDSPRIKIYCNEVNSGVRLTFQRGLQLARHEIIFLCDQDDVWLPGKRNAFVAAFSALLVLSDSRSFMRALCS